MKRMKFFTNSDSVCLSIHTPKSYFCVCFDLCFGVQGTENHLEYVYEKDIILSLFVCLSVCLLFLFTAPRMLKSRIGI